MAAHLLSVARYQVNREASNTSDPLQKHCMQACLRRRNEVSITFTTMLSLLPNLSS
jgi:hypothetical protein